jgi:hypothetical protein
MTSQGSLLFTARQYWSYFLPAWAFPVVLAFFSNSPTFSEWLYPSIVLAVFFLVFSRAALPWMRQKIRYWPAVFWSMLTPFLLWFFAVVTSWALFPHRA